MENENVENENVEMIVKGFNEIGSKRKTKQEIFTNIDDKKQIFNLDSNIDFRINDCKGETLRVKQVMIKRFIKDLDEPIVSITGEMKDKEIKIVTILIDDNGKSYVTGSKSFGLQFIRYIEMFGIDDLENEGLEIKIIEKPVSNSNNKALAFEII